MPLTKHCWKRLDNIEHAKPPRPSRSRHARLAPRRRELDAIILKCLAKAPVDRYASAGPLASDLENLLTGRRVAAAPNHRITRWAPLVSILVLIAIAGTVLRRVNFSEPRVFQLPAMVNSVGMRMVRLPAGRINVRSDVPDANGGARPTWVNLQSFSISATEVTQAQYADVMGENPSDRQWRGPTLPAQNMTWDDAVEFCRRLSAKENRHYRLPTEAEWEYACEEEAALQHISTSLDEVGWHAGNSAGMMHPVAQKEANPWGLYDMLGGVAEWCANDPTGLVEPGYKAERPPDAGSTGWQPVDA